MPRTFYTWSSIAPVALRTRQLKCLPSASLEALAVLQHWLWVLVYWPTCSLLTSVECPLDCTHYSPCLDLQLDRYAVDLLQNTLRGDGDFGERLLLTYRSWCSA